VLLTEKNERERSEREEERGSRQVRHRRIRRRRHLGSLPNPNHPPLAIRSRLRSRPTTPRLPPRHPSPPRRLLALEAAMMAVAAVTVVTAPAKTAATARSLLAALRLRRAILRPRLPRMPPTESIGRRRGRRTRSSCRRFPSLPRLERGSCRRRRLSRLRVVETMTLSSSPTCDVPGPRLRVRHLCRMSRKDFSALTGS